MDIIRKKGKKYNWEKLVYGISILFVLLTIAPLLIACCYAVPAVDDFAAARTARYWKMEGLSSVAIAFKQMVLGYLEHQGTFTGYFFQYMFSTMFEVRLIPTRITLLFITGLFLVTLYFLYYSFMQHIINVGRYKFLINFIYVLLVYVITIGHNVKEVFYWISGAFVYTVPLSFMFAGIIFMMKALQCKYKENIVAASVMCFLSTGGTLPIAAFTNVIVLGVGIYEFKQKRDLKVLPVFLCSLMGAVINVIAPGNYIRQNNIGAELNIVMAVKNSCIAAASCFMNLIRNSPLLLIVIIFMLIGSWQISVGNVYRGGTIIRRMIYSILGVIIIDFPVMFAYGTLHIEPRVLFVQNIAVAMATMVCSLCIGQILAHILRKVKIPKLVNGIVGLAVIIMLIALMYTGNYDKSDIIPVAIYMNLANGNMKEFDEGYKEIFELLECGEDKDVVIERYPSDMGILKPLSFRTDADYWINKETAKYYGCNTITLKE